MQFNSYIFILLFLPLTVIGYFLINKGSSVIGKMWIVLTSTLFYVYAGFDIAAGLGISIVLNYLSSCILKKEIANRRIVFFLTIFLNIASLVYFKYHDFYIEEIGFLVGKQVVEKKLVLPLGISFFTIQQIIYIVDVYRDPQNACSFLDYLLYILFFPKLIMGPITRPSVLVKQFNQDERKHINLNNIASGIRIFAYGLLKKTLLADTFSAAVAWGFNNISRASSADLIIVMLSYTFEIYFDFSGYCDMAVGVAQMLNIDLPINFDSPYKAISIRDFWKRWHISLTDFLTYYIYVPLGGNRKGKFRTYFNIILVFVISGMWHGANWTFILWGLLHGCLSVIERAMGRFLDKLSKGIRWICTFITVNVLWLLFTCSSVSQWQEILRKIIGFENMHLSDALSSVFAVPETMYIADKLHIENPDQGLWIIIFIIAAFIICLIPENNYRTRKSVSIVGAVSSATAFVWGFICLSGESTFVYFGF